MNKETKCVTVPAAPEAKREERTCSNCGSNKNCEEFRDRDPAYSKEPCEMWFQYPAQKPAPEAKRDDRSCLHCATPCDKRYSGGGPGGTCRDFKPKPASPFAPFVPPFR